MNTTRTVRQVLRAKPTIEGAGVRLKRVFGYPASPRFDPFLMMDDFHGYRPADYILGFPWHPHRGIETITYVLHGEVEHGDSMGNQGVIHAGDVQWMTAGSGIVHQEMPKGQPDGLMWGFQLWANLPAAQKMMEPRYRDVSSQQIPLVTLEGGATVRVICGEVHGVRGPVRDIITNPEYLDVQIPAGGTWTHGVPRGYTAFAYAIAGEGRFDPGQDSRIGAETLALYGDGDELTVATGEPGVRFLLISGQPIGEPVAWRGPIVMNTEQELRLAFEEYQNGTFLKHRRPQA